MSSNITDSLATTITDEKIDGLRATVYSSKALSIARLFAAAVFTVSLGIVQTTAMWLKHPLAKKLPAYYHRKLCKIFGIKLVVRGTPNATKPTLFVSNHTSYLDITVVGAKVPGQFVSKSEVASWPVAGWLARMQHTIFIERKRGEVEGQKNQLAEILRAGTNLILFPEGTTNDGARVLPFKSSLFSVAEENIKDLVVQPVSIVYSHINGLPTGHHLRPFISWYGDMTMAGHMFTLLGLGRIQATITFHEPIEIKPGIDRKSIANQSFREVQAGVLEGMTGRIGNA